MRHATESARHRCVIRVVVVIIAAAGVVAVGNGQDCRDGTVLWVVLIGGNGGVGCCES